MSGHDWSAWTDADLEEAAQGCTEATCIYHGPVNIERHRRAKRGDDE